MKTENFFLHKVFIDKQSLFDYRGLRCLNTGNDNEPQRGAASSCMRHAPTNILEAAPRLGSYRLCHVKSVYIITKFGRYRTQPTSSKPATVLLQCFWRSLPGLATACRRQFHVLVGIGIGNLLRFGGQTMPWWPLHFSTFRYVYGPSWGAVRWPTDAARAQALNCELGQVLFGCKCQKILSNDKNSHGRKNGCGDHFKRCSSFTCTFVMSITPFSGKVI